MANYKCPPQNRNFSDNLVGLQTTDGGGLTLGTFEFSTAITEKVNRNFETGNYSTLFNNDNLNLNPVFAASVYNNNFRLYPNFDETDLSNFVSYGSLSKRLEVAVNNILNYFPAALDVRCTTTASTSADTAINISYDANEDETLLTIPYGVIRNPFNIDYRTNATVYLNSLEFPVSKYRNFTNKFRSYSLILSGSSYELVSVQSTPNFTSNLTMYVKGNPFSGLTSFNQNFLVRLNDTIVNEVFNLELGEIEEALLNRFTTPIYTYQFQIPTESDDGYIYNVIRSITWPLDGVWNLDILTLGYENYISELQILGVDYDNFKTNIISRFYTTNALKEFDTLDGKVDKTLKIYGRSFDETKKYIDGVQYVNSVNYNIGNDIPSGLVTNMAQTLGWSIRMSPIANSNFLESVYGTTENAFPAYSTSQTQQDLNNQYFRNLILNSSYLYRSKGTRKTIEFLLNFIGAPEALIEFNENVYMADTPINVQKFNLLYSQISGGTYVPQFASLDDTNTYSFQGVVYSAFTQVSQTITTNTTLADYPVDSEGYPVNPQFTQGTTSKPSFYFQKGEGWIESTTQHRSPEQINYTTSVFTGQNINIQTSLEPFTYGDKFLDRFRNFPFMELGFNIKKVQDNKKSWTDDNTGLRKNTDNLFNAYYNISTDRLLLNVKNTEIFLNPAQALAYDVWYVSATKNYPIPYTGLSSPYPQTGGTDWTFISPQPQNKTFYEFYKTFWNNMINVRNRQFSSDGKTSGYPTLQSLFWKYLTMYQDTGLSNDNFSYQNMIEYINGLGDFWIKLIEQFVPATTIWNTGTKFENSIFHRQKFIYRRQRGCQLVLQEIVGPVTTGTLQTNSCDSFTYNIDVPSILNIGNGLGVASQQLATEQGFTGGYTTVSAKYGFRFQLIHTNTDETFTFEYNNGPTYYYSQILPTETQWTNTINQGLVYFATSGINNDAGVQIIYNSNTEQLQVVSVICGFEDVVISEISILYDIQIQG
jgi:hypothetical protein